MKYKVFVLGLDSHKTRADKVLKQCMDFDIDAEYFSGFNAMEKSQQEINVLKAPRSKMKKIIGNDMSNGEVGCALSHKMIYEKIIKEDLDYALILEDDALLYENSKMNIDTVLNAVPVDADVILCGWNPGDNTPSQTDSMQKNITENLTIYRCYEIKWRTHAYIVTRKGAKALIKSIGKHIQVPADIITGDPMYSHHNLYFINPPIIGYDEEQDSLIQAERDTLSNQDKRFYYLKFSQKRRKKIISSKNRMLIYYISNFINKILRKKGRLL